MKKRLLTLAMAGVMVTAAMAPVAMAAQGEATGKSKVTYVSGAGVPEGSDGTYYVVFPADITLTDSTTTGTQKISLGATNGDLDTLDSTLEVDVTVSSANTALLKNTTYGDVEYSITYTGGTLNKSGAANVPVGTLTPANAEETGTVSLTSPGALPKAPKGTIFSDTLTFKITQTAPTIQ